MAQRVMLLVGTPKGAFILDGRRERREWQMRGPLCDGWPIHDVTYDPKAGALFAGGGSPWYGPAVFRSNDLGVTWTPSSEGLTYGDDGPAIPTVWNVTPSEAGVLAGVEPAGLFRSGDGGRSWAHVSALRDHPSRPEWQPGAGGLILHSIIVDPGEPRRQWVGISAVGVFQTEDDGATWDVRNRGVRADFNPNPDPEFGQCVHKVFLAAGEHDVLYQQNHCGVYRTDDGGRRWTEITGGLPSQFGFPMVGHPRDEATAWLIPLTDADQGRFMPGAAAAVWRTRDRGGSWERLAEGLPQENAYLGVRREAMGVDRLDPVGVYFGTSSGELYGSSDEGATWQLIASHLPDVWAVDVAVVED
jgi:photosystem II stability/assembly factor-like uncharacterized protein